MKTIRENSEKKKIKPQQKLNRASTGEPQTRTGKSAIERFIWLRATPRSTLPMRTDTEGAVECEQTVGIF